MSDALKRFQRTIRRLSVLRMFAKNIDMEFDIENMEISEFVMNSPNQKALQMLDDIKAKSK